MKWTFANIRLKKFPSMPTEWVLKITTGWQLLEYLGATTDSRVANAVSNLRDEKHFTNSLTYLSDLRASLTGSSFAQALVEILDTTYKHKVEFLEQGKTLYLKASGGYSYDSAEDGFYDVLEEKESDDLIFPTVDVRFIQWPNGTHWYAKIGDVDIEWKDKQKWDTKAEAEYAARQWKRSKGMSVRSGKMDSLSLG